MKLLDRFPPWYTQVWGLALTIMFVLALAYALGAGGIRSGGAKINFDRE